ncbi:MAG: YihY/virulence factor BrkB family protein [Candidatus Kapabacteria bacterium]|nr:YihY/virulence factor BrkB family protein [Candidatus Kapabacteria bacterium]
MTPLTKRTLTSLRRAWDVVYNFADITDRRHIFLLSSGIAFNLLLCTIPLVILVLSIVSGVVDETQTKSTVQQALVSFLPKNTQASSLIGDVVKELGAVFSYRTAAGWIAGVALLWLASTLFSSLRTGLNAIFHIETPKFFVWYRLKDMLMTIITATLIVVVTLLSPLMTLFETSWSSALPGQTQGLIFGLTVRVASLISTTILFLLLYRLVPNRKLPWPIILMSTGIAVLLWELARILFSWYVSGATNFSKFYGGYVALASFALWLYYSSFVFLIAAEMGQYIHELRTKHEPPAV